MKASARVVAEADGRGGTRLAVLHGESPLLLRRTGARTGPGVTVHLVGGAAGPLRGDDLRLEISVGPGAALEMRSVAAQLALPGRDGLPPSRLTVHASVAAGGTLRWLPEPLIAAAGCDHVTVTRVEAADGAMLLWRDDLVCGRHGEDPGDVRTETTIRYAGRTLYRHDLSVGPAAPGWSGAAILGGGRAIGTLIAAPPPPDVALRATGDVALRAEGTAPSATSAAVRAREPALHATETAPRASGTAFSATDTSLRASGTAFSATDTSLRASGTAFSATDTSLRASGTASSATGRAPAGEAAVMPLAGPGILATAIGADIRHVRAALDPLCETRQPAAVTV